MVNASDDLATAILDVMPTAAQVLWPARVSTYWPRYDDTGVTGVGGLSIRLPGTETELPCAWLRSLDESARAGAISVGTTVLALMLPGSFVVADVLITPASLTSLGGTA